MRNLRYVSGARLDFWGAQALNQDGKQLVMCEHWEDDYGLRVNVLYWPKEDKRVMVEPWTIGAIAAFAKERQNFITVHHYVKHGRNCFALNRKTENVILVEEQQCKK